MNRSELIKELLSVKNYNIEFLNSKTYDQLKGIRDGKVIKNLIERRKDYEDKLKELDSKMFNDKKLKLYDFDKIKDLYKDFILKKLERINYVQYITQKTKLLKERVEKWSTIRLKNKVKYLKDLENKNNIMRDLKEYGDCVTTITTPLNIQKQRLNFLKLKGSKDRAKERKYIVKKINIIKKEGIEISYKELMTKNIEELKTYYRTNLINFLIKYNYDPIFLKNQKIYVLEYLKSDLLPCEKGSRKELIQSLAKKNIWSRNTLRNWDTNKLINAYLKNVQNNYSPLSEYVPNRPLSKSEKEKYKDDPHPRLLFSREQILKDLSEVIYFDIVTGN